MVRRLSMVCSIDFEESLGFTAGSAVWFGFSKVLVFLGTGSIPGVGLVSSIFRGNLRGSL